jgi:hypothetical protein
VDDHPAIILGSVLGDFLAGELHGLLVIAIAVHCGEAYMPKLCSKSYSSSKRSIVVLYGPKGYLCCGSTIVVALQEKEEIGRETIIQATSTKKRNTNTDQPAFLWQIQIQYSLHAMPGYRLQRPRLPCFAPLYPEVLSPHSRSLSNGQRRDDSIPDPCERERLKRYRVLRMPIRRGELNNAVA